MYGLKSERKEGRRTPVGIEDCVVAKIYSIYI